MYIFPRGKNQYPVRKSRSNLNNARSAWHRKRVATCKAPQHDIQWCNLSWKRMRTYTYNNNASEKAEKLEKSAHRLEEERRGSCCIRRCFSGETFHLPAKLNAAHTHTHTRTTLARNRESSAYYANNFALLLYISFFSSSSPRLLSPAKEEGL